MEKVDYEALAVKVQENVNDKVKKHLQVEVKTGINLRCSREEKFAMARKEGCWTILINEAGTLAWAVHPSGKMFGPFTGPEYLARVQEESIINYFLNSIKVLL